MIDYETEYNNRARVPEHPALIAGWAADAAAFRTRHAPIAGLAYGERERARYDLFLPESPAEGPVALFVHGGYWQALDRSFFSHMAAGPLAHGVPVAVMSYDLCPAVSLAAIVRQVQDCVRALWLKLERPVIVYGHSAGGHLAAMMLATDWRKIDRDLPERPVPAALAVSGLFDLRPLVETSVNDKLGLDVAQAWHLSPLRLPAPQGLHLDSVVGGAESAEYLRQTREITEIWGAAGSRTTSAVLPDENHFTVIASFAQAEGVLTKRLMALVRALD